MEDTDHVYHGAYIGYGTTTLERAAAENIDLVRLSLRDWSTHKAPGGYHTPQRVARVTISTEAIVIALDKINDTG